jgi:hypothetical protein
VNVVDGEQARQRFDELRRQRGLLDIRVLEEVFDALDPVDCDSILGEWTGGDFETGHFMARDSKAARWYGKTFNSRWDAKPLICYAEDGSLFSNTALTGGAEASLWMVEFRGAVSAALIFDAQPIVDHFRRVDNDTLMGVSDGRPELVLDNGEYSYFYLDRVSGP